jgi:beta-hydroxylase
MSLVVLTSFKVPWPEKFIAKKGWDVLGLYAFENRLDHLCEICPETTKLLETIPGLQTALFSCLRPRAHIKPHVRRLALN